jgi:hypothetical protein
MVARFEPCRRSRSSLADGDMSGVVDDIVRVCLVCA